MLFRSARAARARSAAARGVLVHATVVFCMIMLIIMHVYAAIWTSGTIRAMFYGTVTRAWAKQHHHAWYRKMTGDNR